MINEIDIIQLYTNGQSINAIAKQYSCQFSKIREILVGHKISIRSVAKANNLANRKYFPRVPDINHLTDQDYYWAGFIAADGNLLQEQYKYVFQIALQPQDKIHLKKLCQYFKIPIILKKTKVGAYQLRFTSKDLFNFYNSLWITPRKSLTYRVHPILKNNRHFWRGIIDGDGCLTFKRPGQPELHLTGTYDVCEKFQQFVNHNCNISPNKIYHYNKGAGKTYEVKYSAKDDVIKICQLLYDNTIIYLDRKQKKYLQY